jgi:hypothetical protein
MHVRFEVKSRSRSDSAPSDYFFHFRWRSFSDVSFRFLLYPNTLEDFAFLATRQTKKRNSQQKKY